MVAWFMDACYAMLPLLTGMINLHKHCRKRSGGFGERPGISGILPADKMMTTLPVMLTATQHESVHRAALLHLKNKKMHHDVHHDIPTH
jgi:hypothetical protein